MPIGVPRIIYCWGEELPAQWTDIYNFIFRRRMVFLMQYLDDELCNQICGLLINIHMEDRSKELEKKEMEKSGLFKTTTTKTKTSDTLKTDNLSGSTKNSKRQSVEDLLTSDQDFGIEDNHMLEQYTLQKITTEWLNWNAQFFDYSDPAAQYNILASKNIGFQSLGAEPSEQPYLFYLADILSKDFSKNSANLKYGTNLSNSKTDTTEMTKLIQNLKNFRNLSKDKPNQANLDVYSPFRLLANFAPQNYNLDQINQQFMANTTNGFSKKQMSLDGVKGITPYGGRVRQNLLQKEITEKLQIPQKMFTTSEKALGQRRLKREYNQDKLFSYLDQAKPTIVSKTNNFNKTTYRKQTERVMQEEESKKVFMIINSFGGSVGNGITVHDALQFIKAGSLTLALGVAASAASLALAGGTIGERYVTEGCHTMIHQPEGGLNGQASDIWIDSQEIMKIRLDVAEIYSLSTYRPRHKILRDLDRDFYLTAMETIYYGLADEIATNDVMRDIVEMTNKVWDYHDSKQQRLLETRDSQTAGLDTQTQN
uniref:ATP-dependent Clp protease proteolytic subunit n=1 Tax=Volvulina compacta TaxID=51721 RepID=A0A6C0RXA8_9CHLO|nr:ATP-dependent Clp protease proteolytic subunit [Volvulina compacta]